MGVWSFDVRAALGFFGTAVCFSFSGDVLSVQLVRRERSMLMNLEGLIMYSLS